MKCLAALFLLLVGCVSATAQTKTRVTLDLGAVTVWLGEPKSRVLADCSKYGYKASPPVDGMIIIQNGEGDNAKYYTATFKAEKLIFADRSWEATDGDHLLGVMGSLRNLQGWPCSIRDIPLNDPDKQLERIIIDCGDRSVLLLKGRLSNINTVSVSERIGDY